MAKKSTAKKDSGLSRNAIERIVVAAILVPLVIVVVFFIKKPVVVGCILAVVAALAAFEFARMSPMKSNMNLVYGFSALTGLFPIVVAQAGRDYLSLFMVVAVLVAMAAPMAFDEDIKKRFDKMLWFVLGVCYIGLLTSHFQMLWGLKGGRHMLMLVCVMVWVNDIGAYVAGSNFGKNKMTPELSPKKTYEGLLGGAAAAVGSAFIYAHFHKFPVLDTGKMFILAFAVVVAATIGDLFESFIKRYAGVKDSGTLLKGHGGVLDRIDSLIFAVPVAYYVIRYL